MNRDKGTDAGRAPLAWRSAVGQRAILLMVLWQAEEALDTLGQGAAHFAIGSPLPILDRKAK